MNLSRWLLSAVTLSLAGSHDLPRRVESLLAPDRRRRSLPLLLGGLLLFLGVAATLRSRAEPPPSASSLRRTLPNGVTIELVGIQTSVALPQNPYQLTDRRMPGQWRSPKSGAPIISPAGFYDDIAYLRPHIWPAGQGKYTILLWRAVGMQRDSYADFSYSWGNEQYRASWSIGDTPTLVMAYPAQRNHAHVAAEVASGPWRRLDGDVRAGGRWSLSTVSLRRIQPPMVTVRAVKRDADGGVSMDVISQHSGWPHAGVFGWQIRGVALLPDNRRIASKGTLGLTSQIAQRGRGTLSFPLRFSTPGVRFVLEARPFLSADFGDIVPLLRKARR